MSWHSTMNRFLCGPGEQEDTDVELSPEGPHHPAPRAAAPHLHLEVSLAIYAQPGQSAKVISFTSPKPPMPSGQPQTARVGLRVLGSKSRKRQNFWGPPGCPQGPSLHELTLLCCSCSPCPVCPEQLLGRLHVASCPAPLPAQSHHSDPPRLCLRSPFLHFYFYFSAKSTPSALCVPFCLP